MRVMVRSRVDRSRGRCPTPASAGTARVGTQVLLDDLDVHIEAEAGRVGRTASPVSKSDPPPETVTIEFHHGTSSEWCSSAMKFSVAAAV